MVTALGESVWWIDLGIVNAYLVDDDGVLTLIDAGMPWHSGDIVDGIVEAGFTLSDLDRALLTHYDFDHVGALERLKGLGATVYAGAEEAPLITGRRSPGWRSRKKLSQSVAGLFHSGTDVEVLGLTDGESVGSFTVYDTPGHTDGHVVYVSEDHDAAFLGDLVRESDGELVASPWYVSEDVARVRESIRSFVERAPDFEIAAMGHGVPFRRDGDERLADLAGTLQRTA
jgi:glyoxylase-like metal-dependent hydrolase (beta-lactamase superfamily II)